MTGGPGCQVPHGGAGLVHAGPARSQGAAPPWRRLRQAALLLKLYPTVGRMGGARSDDLLWRRAPFPKKGAMARPPSG